MARVSDSDLAELKQECFRNAIRLFYDACALFANRSWPTSYALGVLAYEELGKCLMVDRILDDICLNPRSRDDFVGWLTSRSFLTNHRRKQAYAALDGVVPVDPRDWWKRVTVGTLDRQKEVGLYVDFTDGRLGLPNRISKLKAFDLLKQVLGALESVDDIGYNGVDAYPTQKSKWLSDRDLQNAKCAFEQCAKEAG